MPFRDQLAAIHARIAALERQRDALLDEVQQLESELGEVEARNARRARREERQQRREQRRPARVMLPEQLRCVVCGRTNSKDADHCQVCSRALVKPLPECPCCQSAMKAERVGQQLHWPEPPILFFCQSCGGIWLPKGQIRELLLAPDMQVLTELLITRSAGHAHGRRGFVHRRRSCLACTRPLVRRAHGSSQVAVDYCAMCGVFFDRDELPRLLAGGAGFWARLFRSQARIRRQILWLVTLMEEEPDNLA